MTDYKFHVLTVDNITVLVKVYKSKRAIAANVQFPGPSRVRREIKERYPWVKDRRLYKAGDTLVLYWTGRLFVEKSEYDGRIENLQKRWLKVADERSKKATVRDALNFMRESRRNSVNCDVKSNIKAGLTNMKAESC
jgi:hypothetical protein